MNDEQLREIEARFAESRRWTSGPHVDACCHDVPVLLVEVRRLQVDAAVEAEATASTLAGAEQDRREARAEIERLSECSRIYKAHILEMQDAGLANAEAAGAEIERLTKIVAAERALRKAERDIRSTGADRATIVYSHQRAALDAESDGRAALRALGVEP